MSWTRDLAHGLAQYLADHDVGTYRPSGIYPEHETGIVIGAVPQSPSRIVALTPYLMVADPSQADDIVGLQVRARSAGPDPRDALDLTDAAFDALVGAAHLQLDGVVVHLVELTGSAPMGRDESGRYEHVTNYQLTAHHPTPNRT
ncbi:MULTISPECIES: minor capsid protein [Bacteria]|uniref:DUF3168 domain-containing protein n=2 Tax=Bacteria TaxID=2 RepID=A0A1I4UKR5_9BURK|nr:MULTISPECIES: minor capsid protein [Bacteria]SFE68224.1 hypothetical protein SAMN05216506_113144 [Saccharopolyspora kobensis]SFM89511.1 hypothetical protein SAMN02982985_05702 [Rugamonas rubra]